MVPPDESGKKVPGPQEPARPVRNPTYVGLGPLASKDVESSPEIAPPSAPAVVVPSPAGPQAAPRRERKPTMQGVGPPAAGSKAPASEPILATSPEPNPRDSEPSRPVVKVSPPALAAVVLMIGGGHAMQTALAEALLRHGLDLETAAADTAIDTIVTMAPDLILLVGDATADGGREILERLALSRLSRTIPVAMLADTTALGDRLKAFRHGAAAVIRRTASVDEIAVRVTTLARQMPERDGQVSSSVGDVTLEELLSAVSDQLKHDVQALRDAGVSDDRNLRLVLSGGRDVAQLIDEFVGRVQDHVLRAERLDYEFAPSGGSAELLGADAQAQTADAVRGTRLVIADEDPARADAVAHDLRAYGANVLVTDLEPGPDRFQRLRQLDPIAVVIGSDQAEGRGRELVRNIRTDLRLRWASLVSVRWDDVWPVLGGVEGILGALAATAEPEKALRERAVAGRSFDVPLESLGPARLLRALAGLPDPMRVTLHDARLRVQIDLTETIVAGAVGEALGERPVRKLVGFPALAAWLAASSGRVRIERAERPAAVNVMSPVDVALEMADAEAPPILPSSRIPPAAAPSVPPAPVAAEPVVAPASPANESAEKADSASTPLEPVAPAEPAFRAVSASSASIETEPLAVSPAEKESLLKRRVALPFWMAALLGALLLALAISGVFLLRRPSDRASRSAASPSEQSTAPGGKGDHASGASAGDGLLERARSGQDAALKELAAGPSDRRSVDEALALAAGRAQQKRRSFAAFGAEIAKNPALLDKPENARRLLEVARDGDTTDDAVAAIAALPAPHAADLLFDVWTRTPGRTRATEIAEELVQTEAIRAKASPALLAALDLRRLKTCDEAASTLSRVKTHGDKRSLSPLGRLTKKTGCGPKKAGDCWACLRDGTALNDALVAAKRRPGPRY